MQILVMPHKFDGAAKSQSNSCCTHLDSCQVMRANGHKRSLSAQVLVQLVLKINEATVAGAIKVDASQHSSYSKWPHQCCLWLDSQLQRPAACSIVDMDLVQAECRNLIVPNTQICHVHFSVSAATACQLTSEFLTSEQ